MRQSLKLHADEEKKRIFRGKDEDNLREIFNYSVMNVGKVD